METPYLSFSNPNYHFEDAVSSHDGDAVSTTLTNRDVDMDVNIMTLANQKKDVNKMEDDSELIEGNSKRNLVSQNSLEDVNSVGSEDLSSDEENDDVDPDLVDASDNSLDKANNECVDDNSNSVDTNPYTDIQNKPRGILSYIALLEASAKERRNIKKKIVNSPDDFIDDSSGQSTPLESETLRDKTFSNQGFDINSPDSHDSGIQSDDGLTQGERTGSDDVYMNRSYIEDQEEDDGQEVEGDGSDKTPTETENAEDTGDETTEPSLPPGWEKCEDEDGPYYWHIKSGTIQREPPSPAPPDFRETLRSISINSDSSNASATSGTNESIPSTPSSLTSTEEHLHEFEDHALQYAVKSLQNLSSQQQKPVQYHTAGEKPVRYAVMSLGWVEIAEEDLTAEKSSKAVNKCIVDLTLGRNDINDVVGRWGDGKDLYMDLDTDSLRLLDPQDFSLLNCQPIQTIRVWGVGRDNGRDFAYVARDKMSRKHMCHVFRCDTPARHIANTLRDICKKIMMERTIQQSALNRLTRPTDLPNLDTSTNSPNGQKLNFPNASFPTPMEEPKKILRGHYLGCEIVNKPTGMDVLNLAIDRIYKRVPPERWTFVSIAVAPSTITIAEHGKPDKKIEEVRVRYLSFMGISVHTVKMCAFIVHKAEGKFCAHVFHCEPSAGPLCKTIEAACKLRYQKCLDSHRQALREESQHAKSPVTDNLKSSVENVQSSVKVGVQKVQEGVKTGYQTVQSGVKAGAHTVQTGVKSGYHSIQSGVKVGVHSVQSGMKVGVHSVQSGVKAGVQTVTNMFSMLRRKRLEYKTDKEIKEDGTMENDTDQMEDLPQES